jgi:hypothetical protein
MKFFTPILQGVIVLLIASLIGGGFQVYAQVDELGIRVDAIETTISKIDATLNKVELCREK